MARVTDTGVEALSADDYKTELGAAFRRALGAELVLDDETPQGQIIGLLAMQLSEIDEVIVDLGSANSIDLATGRHLDDLCLLLNVTRRAARTTKVDLKFSGTAGTPVPRGTQALSTAGDAFATIDAGTVGGGAISSESVEQGAIAAGAATITQLVDQITGVDSVTNAAAGTVGRVRETDDELRARYVQVRSRNAIGTLASVRASVLEVDGVDRVRVQENATTASATTQTIAIAANSIYVVVEGSGYEDGDVAEAIARVKAAGIGTVGGVSEDVGTPSTTIRFARTTDIPIEVSIGVTLRDGFPSDGVAQIEAALSEHVGRLGIGYGLASNELYGPAYSIPGHVVTSLTVGRKGATGAVTTAGIPLNATLSLATADITVTAS